MFDLMKGCCHHISAFNTEEEWNALEKCLHVKQVKKGKVLLDEGEVSNFVVFVNSGLLRLSQTENDKTFTCKLFVETEFASAYESFLTKTPTTYRLDALENSELFYLYYDDLQDLYKKYPVYERLGRLIAEDLFIFICNRNISLIQKTPEEKYLQLLNVQPSLLQRVPQYIIASYLGITPETLSRVRKKMISKKIDRNQEILMPVSY